MYGSKAVCCSSGGQLVVLAGLQSASLPGAASSSCSYPPPHSFTPAALLSLASDDARYSCFAAPYASSPTSCLRPYITSQLSLRNGLNFGSRKTGLHQTSCVPFSPLLLVRATRPQQRFLRLQTSRQAISTTSVFSGDQIRSRARLCRVLNADVNPEVEVEEDELPGEVKRWAENEEKTNTAEQPQNQEQQKQRKKLQNRIVFGVGIGAGFLGVVLAGGWVFTLAFSCAIWVATGEYFDMLRSKSNIASGMTPPPLVAAKVCAAICSVMPIMTLYYGGRVGVVVTTSAFGLVTVLLLQKGPRFSQLTSAIFGLIYCGYLPSFWIKLRCGLAIPALNTRIAAGWPILLGGQAHWTVGLVATIISCSAIAAADTFSFLGGKTFGKTPLIAVSPKKTIEGAAVGLSCTIVVTILLSKLFQWPASTPSAALLAVIVFMSSLFGDLTESMMKRDAGVKDSGHLIPGHGGILDRVDSYIFTGALVYSFVKIGLPLFGV